MHVILILAGKSPWRALISATFINVHTGIMPQYRGLHGAHFALVEGDAACMRTQTPAPSRINLPRRTAIAGDTGLRSRNMS
jgi:hypothetical protein